MAVDIEQFKIGDLVKFTYYDWGPSQLPGGNSTAVERSSIGFVIDIVEDPDEKQIDLFPKVLVYDTRMQETVLTHSHNIEFISRSQ